ncbi:DUF4153 domain-containing protein [Falsirhodobacter sp. 1013]|uniref:DUF4153 domain-containing protein n=1 Tax=Falsirhodobacter sp. 1013 TaxID=3417566 RepID=UPI003EBA917D
MTQAMQWRAVMALIGGLAGTGLWAIYRMAGEMVLPDRPLLALIAFTCAFFTGLLAMAGPLSPGRAALRAAGVAAVASALLVAMSLRFDLSSDRHGSFGVVAFLVLVLVPLPFCIASGARDYAQLFHHSWGIVARFIAATLFTGVFWAVVFLSDSLLSIVGIHWIGRLIDHPGTWMVLTGVAFGLAIAVADELSDYVTPFLILRLMRLLIPVVLVVVTVFIVALPLRGVSGLFGGFSAAGTLLAICAAIATLVTVAVDRDDAHAVQLPLTVWSARALAVILPVPAALALWAITVRVGEYGWTPSRVASILAGVVGLVYGLAYLAAAPRRGWMNAIRRGNVWLAGGLMLLAVAWLTPLLNAQRIAAQDQAERIRAGRVTAPENVPFDDWGRAGKAARAELGERIPAPPAMRPLEEVLAVRPADHTAVRDRILGLLPADIRHDITERCHSHPEEGRPGCVMVVGPFLPDQPGDQGVVLAKGRAWAFLLRPDGMLEQREVEPDAWVTEADIAGVLDGRITFAPVRQNRLMLGTRGLTVAE